MSSNYEKSQLTKILISSLPTTSDAMETAVYLDLSCTLKEAQFTGGQKQAIDVTTLCSTEQENVNGLPAPSEISLSGNFYRNAAQDALRDAYDNDTALKLTTDLPAAQSVAVGAPISMAVAAAGGKLPYSYAWKKGGVTISGQTSDTFNKSSAVSGDAGDYTCVVTDSSAPVKTITSSTCTLTVN